MDKKKIIVALLLVICLLGIFLVVGCGDKTNNNDVDDSDKTFMPVDEEVFEIETPYCNLKYPTKWEDAVTVEHLEEPYIVEFRTSIDDEEIQLFDIVFDGTGDSLLGTLTVDGEAVEVYVTNYNDDISGYSDNQQMRVNEMIMDINVIISALVDDYGFELA